MMYRLKMSGYRVRQAVPVLAGVLTVGFISYLGAHQYNLTQAVTPASPQLAAPQAVAVVVDTAKPVPAPKPVTFSITPATGSYAKDAVLSVAIRLDSPARRIYAVQPVIEYPADRLAYVSTTPSGAFPSTMRAASAAGTLDLIRGVAPGGTGFIGDDIVAIVNFRVIGTGGNISLSFKSTSGAYDDGGKNRLDSRLGGTYTIAAPAARR